MHPIQFQKARIITRRLSLLTADLIEQRQHLTSLNPELYVYSLERFGRV